VRNRFGGSTCSDIKLKDPAKPGCSAIRDTNSGNWD
jgi:hypothetical protein